MCPKAYGLQREKDLAAESKTLEHKELAKSHLNQNIQGPYYLKNSDTHFGNETSIDGYRSGEKKEINKKNIYSPTY